MSDATQPETLDAPPKDRARRGFVRDDARRAFGRLALINACVAVLGGATMLLGVPLGALVIVGFPALHLCWSLPMIVLAHRRGHARTRKGLLLATGLTLLLSSGCWVLAASDS